MKDRGPWRLWSTFLLIIAGNLYSPIVQCQSYDGARGDAGDSNVAALGFSGVVTRHDGYVKGETPTIPQTSFTCSATPHIPGLYADVETQCQVYHNCFEDRQESFLCGPGTNFNQRILACDFWYNFNCQDSPNFYSVNADIGKVPSRGNQGQHQTPGIAFDDGQSREPQRPRPQPQPQPQRPRPQPQPQQPSYPGFPQQPVQPPSRGSYPATVRVPSPGPQQESIYPQEPIAPQPPSFPAPPSFRPERPVFRPEPPQPPRVYPEPQAPRPPPPPVFKPQTRPEIHQVQIQTQYPRVSSGSNQPENLRPPPPQKLPPSQQEYDNGFQFDGYKPPKPVVLPPRQPTHSQAPRPAFPPVVSPPRVARPPLTPIFRQPEISRPRVPVSDTRPQFHPDSDLKGNSGYRPAQQPRVPQPSRPRPVEDYPNYPVPQRPERPIEKPQRPVYQPPPQTVQQEHVDYVPPPPPPPKEPSRPYVPPPKEPSRPYVPPPKEPSRPYVPPPKEPSRPYVPPPKEPSRPYVPPPVAQKPFEPEYVRPPPVAQKPLEPEYVRPQPPVSPSINRERQNPPPSRPRVTTGSQRPKPVFPPASDHPNSNIKGGPGYHQPPPQIPRFEPTRISRPSNPQISTTAVKQTAGKTPSTSGQGSYKPPQEGRIKKPSEPQRSVYQPPIQVIDHPRAEIKGVNYEPPIRHTQRIQSPSTSITGVKRPQVSGGYQQPQVDRPRAPIVVSRPQPPSSPSTSIKKTSPVDNQVYEKPLPVVSRVKQPSTPQIQTVSRPSQPRFPTHVDHPNANTKGGSGYIQPHIQQVSRPSGPPLSPSTAYEQKTTSNNQGRPSGSGYPGSGHQQVIQQQDYKPSRSSPPSSIKTASKISHGHTAVKSGSSHPGTPSVSQGQSLMNKESKPDYEAGSSYNNGPEVYPKPEFGKPNTPYQPISTPSRQRPVAKQGSPSVNDITRFENKATYPGNSVSAGAGSDIRPDYPFNRVPGHQPPNQRQVFPHRDNPDHPNESLKGSNAYRPPPPAGFQAAASEVQEQNVVPEPEPSDPKHGDTGSE